MLFEIPLQRRSGAEPLFRQIYAWIREAALNGKFAGGEQMPSTRELADQLGVSRTVTLLAYDQLLAEGFLVGRAGSGTYVAGGLSQRDRPQLVRKAAQLRLSRFGQSALDAGPNADMPGALRGGTAPAGLQYRFTHQLSSVELFPFEAWRRILMRVARKAPLRALDYGRSAGSLALREAIVAHLRRSRAVSCDASQVIVVNGSQQALDLAARILLERGDVVCIENPHYQGAREILLAAGARLRAIPVDAHGLDPNRLPKHARLAFVTPSHQFPTGAILPLSRRLALLDWANRTGAVVIEDDYDGEFHYAGQPVESMQGLDSEGRVVYTGTFSRTIFPALRIGYLVAPKSLAEAFANAKWLCDRHTASLEQETLAEFITCGAYERHLRRVRRSNAARREALLAAVAQYLGDAVDVTGDSSGTHVVLWPKRANDGEAALISRAAELGVGISGIGRYYWGANPPQRVGLMLGYSRMKEREIQEGMRRLARVLT